MTNKKVNLSVCLLEDAAQIKQSASPLADRLKMRKSGQEEKPVSSFRTPKHNPQYRNVDLAPEVAAGQKETIRSMSRAVEMASSDLIKAMDGMSPVDHRELLVDKCKTVKQAAEELIRAVETVIKPHKPTPKIFGGPGKQ